MNRRLLRNRPSLASLPVIFALISPIGCGVAKDGAETSGYDSLLAGEVSLWQDSATPAVAAASDTAAVELGVKFRSDSAGEVTGIRFYKGTGNTGTHVGHLWTSTGTLLGSVTFSGETASGWQTARFAAPIAVSANTTYVASYHAPAGRYAANNGFFASSGADTPPLRALANGVDGSNGVYRYGASGFPTSSYQSTNYWVDVVFRPAGAQSNGLTGQYFDNVDLTNLRLTRTDGSVNFSWGSGAPASGIGVDTFSVRWTGQVVPQYSQTYTFYTTSDDGVRLSVNGQPIIDNWTDHAPTENSGTIALTAGQRYDLRLEYYERGGGAVAQLAWSSASQPKQIVPQARLLPTTGTGTGTGGTGGAGGSGGVGGTSGGGGAAGTGGGSSGDTFIPWHGGPSYYSRWSRGLAADPNSFPIAVWLQSPPNATRYQNVGVNLFVGLWSGPTDAQLSELAAAGMQTIPDQGGVWRSHLSSTTIRGWLQQDEPDNAQAQPDGSWGACVPTSSVISLYQTMRANDPSRPVYLNLGRGVADTQWVGRGPCTGRTDMYPEYARGADILSFDIYPVNQGVPLELVARGVDNLRQWVGNAKPVFAAIEGSNYDNTARPSPSQIKTEVWMALVHGAAGLMYFCHRFQPTFSETDCLDDAPTQSALASINAQVRQLAPALNTQSVANGVTVASSNTGVPIDTMLKRHGGATYLFAVAMRGSATTGTFTLRDFPARASAEVIGENRSVSVTGGVLRDNFAGYGVHLYRITQ